MFFYTEKWSGLMFTNYILEGRDLEFYMKNIQKKKGNGVAPT